MDFLTINHLSKPCGSFATLMTKPGLIARSGMEMADMGFAGVLIDEDHGGVNMGFMAAGLLAEQIGPEISLRHRSCPRLVLAATALKHGGSSEAKSEWLPKIASGETIMALALEEGGET